MEKIYSPKNALFLASPFGFGEPGSFQFLGGMPILSRLVKRLIQLLSLDNYLLQHLEH